MNSALPLEHCICISFDAYQEILRYYSCGPARQKNDLRTTVTLPEGHTSYVHISDFRGFNTFCDGRLATGVPRCDVELKTLRCIPGQYQCMLCVSYRERLRDEMCLERMEFNVKCILLRG